MEAWRNELYHHGIKGQRWGVRRGPPYPIDDTVIRKGTRLNSVSGYSNSEEYRNRGRWMYMFNPDDERDSKVYKGPFAYYLVNRGNRYVYEHSYETIKDLKMPTRKERVDEFINLYKSRKIGTTFDLARVQMDMKLQRIGSDKARKLNLFKADSDKDLEQLYEIFNHAMETADRFRSTRLYMNVMEQKYDAMVDDNNQGVYNGAHDPVIVFWAEEALKTIGKARVLSKEEAAQNYANLERELAEKGERIKL